MDSLFEFLRTTIFHVTRFVSPAPIAVEWLFVLGAAWAIAVAPLRGNGWLRRARELFRATASSARLSIAICAVLPVVIRLALLPVAPVPQPSIHDEFSHLLLADTLAHGRLTNPTPDAWRYLETIHVIMRPTYNSMYPPAHAMILAFGQVLFGTPWAGVMLGVGVMCGAICWMMRGWLRPAWALYGSLIAVFKIGIVGLWMNSYLACGAPAIGGALLVGALPRLRRPDSRTGPAIAAGIGIVILMNSRPFEGAVLTMAGLLWLLPALIRRWGKSPARLFRMTVMPVSLLVGAGAIGTAYYCWRVTGSPTRLPYQVNRDAYGWPENLGFLPARTVTLDDPVLLSMYVKEVNHREIYKSMRAFMDNLALRLFDNWTCLIGPVLTIPMLMLWRVWVDRRTRPLLFLLGALLGLNLLQMVLYPYHLAPSIAILFAIVAQGCRHIYAGLGRINPRRARWFACLLPLCLLLSGAMKQEAAELHLPLAYWERAAEPHREARADVDDWLREKSGRHLVIVRYGKGHSPDQEWVYNAADLANSPIVWAREKNPKSNDELLAMFPGREPWLLEADVFPPRVVRYGRAQLPLCPSGPGPAPTPTTTEDKADPLP